jgi:hypothetical protein
MCERGPGGVTAPTRSHCISKLVLTEPRQRCDGNSRSRGACWSASFTVSPTSRRVRRPQASLRSGEGDSLFSTEEVVSTWPLPSNVSRDWSQPTAKVSACFCEFRARPICSRLPPVATTGLHKGSIFVINRDNRLVAPNLCLTPSLFREVVDQSSQHPRVLGAVSCGLVG